MPRHYLGGRGYSEEAFLVWILFVCLGGVGVCILAPYQSPLHLQWPPIPKAKGLNSLRSQFPAGQQLVIVH